MANNNIIDILGRLERRKREQEARLESLQLKARTLKRRREELGQSLADISTRPQREPRLAPAYQVLASKPSHKAEPRVLEILRY